MEKRALHSLVKAAAHNAHRRHVAKAAVKTAAVAALRRQDLRGAILAMVNGEKVAAPLKLPGALMNRAGQFFSTAGREGLRSALSKARGVIGRSVRSHGGLLGAARHGVYLAGKDMLELGRRGYSGARRRFGSFVDNVSGNRLNRFLEEAGVSPEGRKAYLADAVKRYGPEKGRLDARSIMEEAVRPTGNLAADSANAVGARKALAQQRVSAYLKREMNRARRNAAILGGGAYVAHGLMHNPGADYMEG